MANTMTTEHILKIEYYFVDGDTRTQTINNARSNVTRNDILELQSLIRQGNLIIGDKNQAAFGKIKKATAITRLTVKGTYAATPTGKKNHQNH